MEAEAGEMFEDVEDRAGDVEDVCIRREAVRTNWPTAEEKPERKALNG